MKSIAVQTDWSRARGVLVKRTDNEPCETGRYFRWMPSTLLQITGRDVSGGILRSYPAEPVFDTVEYHDDAEYYYAANGRALLFLCDIDLANGHEVAGSQRAFVIEKGMQLCILPGTGHSVPIALGSEYEMAVVAPCMETVKLALSEPCIVML